MRRHKYAKLQKQKKCIYMEIKMSYVVPINQKIIHHYECLQLPLMGNELCILVFENFRFAYLVVFGNKKLIFK